MSPVRRLAAAALLGAAGCSAFPHAADSGRRMAQDGFVVLTAPVQVPWVAAREAWAACPGGEGRSRLWLPVWFVGCACGEAVLGVLHAADLLAAPIHLCAGNGPAPIYRGCEFPLQRNVNFFSAPTGELALYGVAGTGGAAVAWWFGTTYVPGIFRFFTGHGSGLLTGG